MQSLVVNEPADVVFERWTDPDSYADFLPAVTGVTPLGPDRLLWKAEIGGITKRWMTRVSARRDERVVEWEPTDGTANAGRVRVEALDDATSTVEIDLRFCDDVWTTEMHDAHGQPGWRERQSLRAFKAFVEDGETTDGGYHLDERRVELGSMTRAELYELAQERNLRGRSKMRKHELIQALAEQQ